MKIDEQSMRTLSYFLMIFEIVFHKKTSFPKRVNVLRTYVLPSRMRVREGSPKKKEIKKEEKS